MRITYFKVLFGTVISLTTCVANAQNIFPATGNVGIGVPSPTAALAINGASENGLNIASTPDSSAIQTLVMTSAKGKSMWFVTSSCQGCYNPLVQQYDQGLFFSEGAGGTGNFVLGPWAGAGGIRVTNTGNVGIGTPSPAVPLEVAGSVKITAGTGGSLTFQDGSVQTVAWNGVLSGGDYAESVDVTGQRSSYEPGDVLVVDPASPGRISKSAEAYSTAVAGIYSTKPGVRGRRQTSDTSHLIEEVPLAMVGIVPTKVSAENGAIKAGDLLVTSRRPGFAMKGTDRAQLVGAIVGKAMGSLESGTGVIEVLVTLQ